MEKDLLQNKNAVNLFFKIKNYKIITKKFKGKVEEREFLVYINVETGKEEDVLLILDTPNGTLTV